MKKSFLSRAMSAAIAVPVALSQTILCASFAVDDTVSESQIKTITIEDFKQVPIEDSLLSPITPVEGEKYVYEKSSTWTESLKGWVSTMSSEDPIELDASKFADFITGETVYADIIRDAMSNPKYSSAVAEVGMNPETLNEEVTITIGIDYPYNNAVNNLIGSRFVDKYPGVDMTFDCQGHLQGKLVLTASMEALDDSTIPFEVDFYASPDSTESLTVEGIFEYVEETLDSMGKDIKDQISSIVDEYEAQVAEKQAEKDEYQKLKNEKQDELDDVKKDFEEKKAELAEKLLELDKKKVEMKQAEDDLKQAEVDLAAAEAAGEDTIAEEVELYEAQEKYKDAEQQLTKADGDATKAQADAAQAEIDLADAQRQLNEAQDDLDDAQRQLDDAKKQLEEAEEMGHGEVDKMIDSYQEKLQNAREKFENIAKSGKRTYHKNSVNEIIQAAKEDAKKAAPSQSNRIDKIPDTIDEFAKTSIYGQLVDVFTEALSQINGQMSYYDIDLSGDDLLEIAKDMSNITVTAEASKTADNYGVASGTATGELTDVTFSEEDWAYYYDYFNKLLAAENKKVTNIETKKTIDVAGNVVADTMSGEVSLEIKRVFTLTVEDLEETTGETTASSDETTVASGSETTVASGSETTVASGSETTTSHVPGSEETGTTTSHVPGSEETGTTTSHVPGSEETGTTTSHVPGSEETGTTTSSNPDIDAGTTTTSDDGSNPQETTTVLDPNRVKDFYFYAEGDTEGNRNFYFSHDSRPFKVEDLIQKAYVREVTEVDGVEFISEEETPVDLEKVSFGLTSDAADTAPSPADVFAKLEADGQEAAYTLTPLYIFYDGYVAHNQVYVYIGVKGDTNLNGVANAMDSGKVLIYAAEYGSGQQTYLTSENGDDVNEALEAFAWFLSDINTESRDMGETSNADNDEPVTVNAKDSAAILVYAAAFGSKGDNADWVTDVLNPNNDSSVVLPKFTKEIFDWKAQNS